MQGKNVTLPQVRLSELVDSDLTKKSVLGETDLTRKSVLGETDFSELVNSQCSQCGQAAFHIPEEIGHKFLSISLPNHCTALQLRSIIIITLGELFGSTLCNTIYHHLMSCLHLSSISQVLSTNLFVHLQAYGIFCMSIWH